MSFNPVSEKGLFKWAGMGTELANYFHPQMFECRKKERMSAIEFFNSDEKQRKTFFDTHKKNIETFFDSLWNNVLKPRYDDTIGKLTGLTTSRMYMNGTLRSWLHYVDIRCDKATQKEHREIADQCKVVLTNLVPSLF
jgi:thymidylate synthase (FAD)